MGGQLYNFQSNDLGTVTLNVDELADSSSELEYWEGQFVVAVLWGMAAGTGVFFPGSVAAIGAALSVTLSCCASGLGSALSYNPTQQNSFAGQQMEVLMGKTFDQGSNQSRIMFCCDLDGFNHSIGFARKSVFNVRVLAPEEQDVYSLDLIELSRSVRSGM